MTSQARCSAAEQRHGAAEAREAALTEEKARLKAGLTAALDNQAALEAFLGELRSEMAELHQKVLCSARPACLPRDRAQNLVREPELFLIVLMT